MQLIQTQNPEIILKIMPFWRNYLTKIRHSSDEAELNRFAACFIPNNPYRFFVLVNEETKKIHGFCVVYMDEHYGALVILQEATDNHKAMHEELSNLAKKVGATAMYFSTERNAKAWERLVGAKSIATTLELPFKDNQEVIKNG
ncbi:MAG: hypothetical protein DRP34_00630 [Thermodesulfobacteriota bacterium]|nr:MAG: hypothetical protein DRP34_00630 [Thermodesulfobacteriota bacterium]